MGFVLFNWNCNGIFFSFFLSFSCILEKVPEEVGEAPEESKAKSLVGKKGWLSSSSEKEEEEGDQEDEKGEEEE